MKKDTKVFFGSKKIAPDEKKFLIKDLFNKVASKYDLMNDIMSFRLHRLWKKDILTKLDCNENSAILDLAGGTGDISLNISSKLSYKKIFVYDISQQMLIKGRQKSWNSNNFKNVYWINGDSSHIPLKNNSLDYVIISFGLRNVSSIDSTLNECVRVLKPGGKFLCLEFSPDVSDLYKKIYDLYSFSAIPLLGKIIAKNQYAYKYLVDSIRNFPRSQELENKMKYIGFSSIQIKRYSGGIAHLHTGLKL